MPGHRVFIETNRASSPEFILRTKSPRPYHQTEKKRVFIIENNAAEMHSSRDAVHRENHVLKAELRDKENELRQNHLWVQQLQHENQELRRSLDSTSDVDARKELKTRELKKKNARLETDNDTLKARIRDLARQLKDSVENRAQNFKAQVDVLRQDVNDWRRRYDDLERRYKLLGRNLDAHVEDNARLKAENDILKRQVDIYERRNRRTSGF
ncbi:hypothetical protein B0H63DRAFT_160606 [Podospora didyma]|uniref:Uncharacterized protein n=1 Tax=Podospora didyma TaxID=330526 RepID=A0AAE0NTV7_9PEZI|nr:hypothetical protein B0H63DRAFT_160606 [Podospora didyma]